MNCIFVRLSYVLTVSDTGIPRKQYKDNKRMSRFFVGTLGKVINYGLSYRPISLLTCVNKISTRIIKTRFEYYLDHEKIYIYKNKIRRSRFFFGTLWKVNNYGFRITRNFSKWPNIHQKKWKYSFTSKYPTIQKPIENTLHTFSESATIPNTPGDNFVGNCLTFQQWSLAICLNKYQ